MSIHKGPEHPEPNERYVRSRAEDRSFWIKIAYVLEKYKLLVWIVILISLAIGFKFKTPAMIVDELQGQITINKNVVDRVVIPRVDTLQSNIAILLKLRCIDPKLTPEQLALVGLNCRKLLGDGVAP